MVEEKLGKEVRSYLVSLSVLLVLSFSFSFSWRMFRPCIDLHEEKVKQMSAARWSPGGAAHLRL
jgi:hypothetical protein